MPDTHAHHETAHHALASDGRPPDLGLVRGLSELARDLQAEPDMDSLLGHIVAATVSEVDGADYGGISSREAGKITAVAATHPVIARLDAAQTYLGEGPCLSSLQEQITVRSDDLRNEQRWPRFTAEAIGEGIMSILSVQLFVEGDNLGALNLYATKPAAYSRFAEYVAMALAAHAAVAMKGSRTKTNLLQAVESRDLIGQGKGILMERYKISGDEAFNLLVMSSQKTHTKLRDIAEHLTATGELLTR